MTVSYSDTIPSMLTNWTDSVTIPKFDPSLGPLLKIDFAISGTMDGDVFMEHTGSGTADVDWYKDMSLELQRPDSTIVVTATKTISGTETLGPYDPLDPPFTPPDGATITHTDSLMETMVWDPPTAADAALFTGLGSIVLPVRAVADSGATGPGALIFGATTRSDASVTVTYTYIPEPSALAVFAAGLIGEVMRRRRQRSVRRCLARSVG